MLRLNQSQQLLYSSLLKEACSSKCLQKQRLSSYSLCSFYFVWVLLLLFLLLVLVIVVLMVLIVLVVVLTVLMVVFPVKRAFLSRTFEKIPHKKCHRNRLNSRMFFTICFTLSTISLSLVQQCILTSSFIIQSEFRQQATFVILVNRSSILPVDAHSKKKLTLLIPNTFNMPSFGSLHKIGAINRFHKIYKLFHFIDLILIFKKKKQNLHPESPFSERALFRRFHVIPRSIVSFVGYEIQENESGCPSSRKLTPIGSYVSWHLFPDINSNSKSPCFRIPSKPYPIIVTLILSVGFKRNPLSTIGR